MAEVVGVVEHERSHDLTRAVRPLIFYPMGQQIPVVVDVAIETTARPAASAARRRGWCTRWTRTWRSPAWRRWRLSVRGHGAGAFQLPADGGAGGIALLLAAVGIFGVIAYTVTQRTREFGIRLALGEDPAQTRRGVIAPRHAARRAEHPGRPGVRSCSTRFLGGLLYQVSPHDPLTLGGIAVVLTLVALAACYLPARRATAVDPAITLRSE